MKELMVKELPNYYFKETSKVLTNALKKKVCKILQTESF